MAPFTPESDPQDERPTKIQGCLLQHDNLCRYRGIERRPILICFPIAKGCLSGGKGREAVGLNTFLIYHFKESVSSVEL